MALNAVSLIDKVRNGEKYADKYGHEEMMRMLRNGVKLEGIYHHTDTAI